MSSKRSFSCSDDKRDAERMLLILYMTIYVSSYYYICVLILL